MSWIFMFVRKFRATESEVKMFYVIKSIDLELTLIIILYLEPMLDYTS